MSAEVGILPQKTTKNKRTRRPTWLLYTSQIDLGAADPMMHRSYQLVEYSTRERATRCRRTAMIAMCVSSRGIGYEPGFLDEGPLAVSAG